MANDISYELTELDHLTWNINDVNGNMDYFFLATHDDFFGMMKIEEMDFTNTLSLQKIKFSYDISEDKNDGTINQELDFDPPIPISGIGRLSIHFNNKKFHFVYKDISSKIHFFNPFMTTHNIHGSFGEKIISNDLIMVHANGDQFVVDFEFVTAFEIIGKTYRFDHITSLGSLNSFYPKKSLKNRLVRSGTINLNEISLLYKAPAIVKSFYMDYLLGNK